MKRFVTAFFILFTITHMSHAQERVERHVAPEGLVKAADMPISWEDANTLLLYGGTPQKPSFYQETKDRRIRVYGKAWQKVDDTSGWN